MINIICVKWGTKYDTYVEKLKTQIENNCTLDYKFFCLTDNPKESYDIQLPTTWDHLYDPTRGKFWAYRKCYMFNEDLFSELDGDQFLYLDQDVLIHNNIDHLFDMDMSKPSIVRGWWNDINNCKKNFGKLKSTLLNSISPDLNLKTKVISEQHQQGQHTTTYAEMFDLEGNARIVDTPGIKGFGVVDMEPEELELLS